MSVGQNVPKSLVRLCQKDGRVAEITNEEWSDGDHLNNYWLTLKDGWNWNDCSSIHENNVKNCKAEMKRIRLDNPPVVFMKDDETLFIDWLAKPKGSKITLEELLQEIETEANVKGATVLQGNMRGKARRRLFERYGFKVVNQVGNLFVMEKSI